MANNDYSDLLNEIKTLKKIEDKTEFLFYSQRIIGNFELICKLIEGLPALLKEKYHFPFAISIEDIKYKILKNGFCNDEVSLSIIENRKNKNLCVKKDGSVILDIMNINSSLFEPLRKYSDEIGKLTVFLKNKIDEDILEAQNELRRQVQEF